MPDHSFLEIFLGNNLLNAVSSVDTNSMFGISTSVSKYHITNRAPTVGFSMLLKIHLSNLS